MDIQPDEVRDLAHEFPFLLSVAAGNLKPGKIGESIRSAHKPQPINTAIKHPPAFIAET